MISLLVQLPLLAVAPAVLDGGDEQYQFILGLFQKGHHEVVVREANAFLREYGGHDKRDLARYRLASSLFELDRHDQAGEHFRELSRLSSFDFQTEVWFRLGQCELTSGRPSPAADAFEHVVELGSDYLLVPATFLLGEARFQTGEYAEAERHYGRVLREDVEGVHHRDAAYGLAWCAYRLDRHEEAARRIGTFLDRFGDEDLEGEMRHLLGETELAVGRASEALDAFRRVPSGPHREAALHGAGFACAELGRHREAARSFETLLAEYPQSRFAGEAVLHLGIHLLQADDAAAALAAFARPQAKLDAELYFWRSRAEAETGDLEGALVSLERARGLRPEGDLAERIQIARGDVLFELGRAEEAARAYGESDSEYALHAAATASFNDGRHEEAVRLAGMLLDRHGDGSYADSTRLTLGEALFALDRFEEAERAFRAVAQSKAEDALRGRALLRAGWCEYLSGDLGSASKTFGRVSAEFSASDGCLEAIYMEGLALEDQGDVDRAVSALARYLERDRKGPHASGALLALARLDGRDSGRRYLEEILDAHSESSEAPHALYDLAERHSAAGDHGAARERYGELLRRYPDHELVSAALYGDAWSSYALGEWDAAIRSLRDLAQRRDEELVVAGLELMIFAADEADQPQTAAKAWAGFSARCTDEDRLLVGARVAAGTLERNGDRDGARALLGSLLDGLRQPAAVVAARVERTWMALAAEDVASAETEVRRALEADAQNGGVLEAAFFVAEAHYEQGDDEHAAPLYGVAAGEGSPVADRALYKQGFAEMRRGDLAAAAEAFGSLVGSHRESELFGEGLFLLGEVRFRQGDHARAAQSFARLLKDVPRHEAVPRTLYRMGVSLVQLERHAEAERALSDLARRFAEFEHGVEAELWRGRALAAQGKDRSARQAFERVVARDEGVLAARARLGLGKLALAGNDVEAALSEFLKVALLYSHAEEVAEALLLSGECLDAKGEAEKARDQYREITDKYPESSSADEARRRLDV